MYIFIDESGTFVHTTEPNAWSVIAAFALPERQLEKVERLISALRAEVREGQEVKLRHLTEARYIRFLRDLSRVGGLAFVTAGDASHMPTNLITKHRDDQARGIIKHVDKTVHQSMRDSLFKLSETVATMPLQLYIQMQLQLELFHKVICRSSLYYAQHEPTTLEFFRWRLDQKDIKKSEYERAFELVLAPALQTKSIKEPMATLEGADYSYFKRFDFPPNEIPTYLTTEYGIPQKDGFNVRKILMEDFAFVDSDVSSGVQAVDLLASGVRRLLRGQFTRAHEVALLIGANLVESPKGENPISLLSLGTSGDVDHETAKIIRTIARNRKPMVASCR